MQRQLRLGDILDDYCPRERRVTNHAVVAMVGEDVKQTRCSTCDTEHEYKHAKVPRQRRKPASPAALYAQVAAGGPKHHVVHEPATTPSDHDEAEEHDAMSTDAGDDAFSAPKVTSNGTNPHAEGSTESAEPEPLAADEHDEEDEDNERAGEDEGPVHRPLIRASLPRPEGQAPPARALPDFTIRQPGGRPNRFRPRHQRGGFGGGQNFQGNRNGNVAGNQRGGGGMPRHGGSNRPPMMKRHGGGGRKRSK